MAKEYKEKKITVNLTKVFDKPSTKRAKAAVFLLRKLVTKETRAKEVLLSNQINEELWQYGRGGSPRKISVKVVNDKGKARVYMPDEKIELKKEEVKKEKGLKAKAEEIAKGKDTQKNDLGKKETIKEKTELNKEDKAPIKNEEKTESKEENK